MDVGRQLKSLMAEGGAIPPLDEIVHRTKKYRLRRRIIAGVLTSLGLLALPMVYGLAQDAKAPPSDIAAGGSGTPDDTSPPGSTESPPCTADACLGEDEELAQGPAWLKSVLGAAGYEYLDGYRPDGGGGLTVTEWGFSIWVLRSVRETPEEEALRWDFSPMMRHDGTDIYGRSRPESPTAYFFWRAGGVDTFVQLDWTGSPADGIEDLEEPFGRIIDSQEASPYSGE